VELLRGLTLRKLLQRHKSVPPEVGAALALELLAALGHAHAHGVVHRDVKPENVILEHRALKPPDATPTPPPGGTTPPPSSEQPGDRVLVKLTDFGIAKLLDAQGVTSTGQVLGSPAHMAPEQIEGGEVDARADVFALGVLLYECMVGHLPFEGSNPAQVLRRVLDGIYPSAEREKPEVGKTWSTLLDRALGRRAQDRFASTAEMRDAILAELKRVGVTTPKAELEGWFDAPEEYVEAHKKRMIAKLCDLGAEARRVGNALVAAADYNRALAYAPADPQLLKIVAGMHRAEAHARLVRRMGPGALGAIALGVLAFFVTRAVRHASTAAPPLPHPTAEVSIVKPDPLPLPSAIVAPVASTKPTPQAPTATVATTTATTRPTATSTATANAKRTLTLAKVRPVAGVLVAVDGDPAIQAASGKSITLSDKPHTLVFTCIEDLCDPQTRAVGAGDVDENVEVELKIKPAKLTIVGDQTKSYLIKELPQLAVHANAAAAVPMTRKTETFHVRELETDREQTVTLTAGQAGRAVFAEE
jgi:serine/threonine-protein kinase